MDGRVSREGQSVIRRELSAGQKEAGLAASATGPEAGCAILLTSQSPATGPGDQLEMQLSSFNKTL